MNGRLLEPARGRQKTKQNKTEKQIRSSKNVDFAAGVAAGDERLVRMPLNHAANAAQHFRVHQLVDFLQFLRRLRRRSLKGEKRRREGEKRRREGEKRRRGEE